LEFFEGTDVAIGAEIICNGLVPEINTKTAGLKTDIKNLITKTQTVKSQSTNYPSS